MKRARETTAVDQTAWDEIKTYQSNRRDYRRRTGIGRARETIVERVGAGARVLDIGCGDGSLLQVLREKGACRVQGIDISPGAIALCRERGLDVVLGDTDNFDSDQRIGEILGSTFDAVVFSKSIQYIHRRDEVLARLNTERIYLFIGNRNRWRHTGAAPSATTTSPLPATTEGIIRWVEGFGFRGSILFFDRKVTSRLNLNSFPLPRFLLKRWAANLVLEFVREGQACGTGLRG